MKKVTPEQTNYIQGRLKMLGHDTVTLARKLGRPWSTVAANINGNRANEQVRREIAEFLGEPVEELFGESKDGGRGRPPHEEEQERPPHCQAENAA